MNRPTHAFRPLAALVAAGLLVVAATSLHAATITIVNGDGAGEGFNDPTVVAPAPGNPNTTLGAQRLFIFQYAANIWGSVLSSPVTIQVSAQFNPLTCTATSATLGSTGANTIHRDFVGAPFAGTWYVQALANKLNGSDLSTSTDMSTQFNSTLDNGSASCLGGLVWYYGTDGNEGVNVELLPVVLHELAHGLGFATSTNANTGNYNSGFPSVYDHFLYDDSLGLYWTSETAAQRAVSSKSVKNLVWNGPQVTPAAAAFLAKRPRMLINSPPAIAGNNDVGTAAFGPALTAGGITGDVVLVQDGTAPVNDGCETLLNGPALAGKIALLDRGLCTFVAKAESVQAYGAIALLIANNTSGIQPPGGTDPGITIPVVGITTVAGNAIKSQLALSNPVNVTLGLDPVLLAGADAAAHPLMYTPSTYASGSTVSHWDVTLTPNALMEPAINQDLHDNLDLTVPQLADIGWLDLATATTLERFTADDRAGGILLTWQFNDPADVGAITVERATTDQGPWAPIGVTAHTVDGHTEAMDLTAAVDVTYFYRLDVMNRSGQTSTYGLVAARHAGSFAGPALLMAPTPNPAPHGSALTFRLTQPEFVRLAIVDASGRTVRTLQNAMMATGDHTQIWDGRGDAGGDVAPGLYFVTLRTSKGIQSKRLAIVR